jgi:hypothetical protein
MESRDEISGNAKPDERQGCVSPGVVWSGADWRGMARVFYSRGRR